MTSGTRTKAKTTNITVIIVRFQPFHRLAHYYGQDEICQEVKLLTRMLEEHQPWNNIRSTDNMRKINWIPHNSGIK